jgi:hypothetical protein
MAGYPVQRPTNDAHGAQRPYVDPHTRTPGVGSDGFMNMSPLVQADDNPWHGHWLLRRPNIWRDNQASGACRFLKGGDSDLPCEKSCAYRLVLGCPCRLRLGGHAVSRLVSSRWPVSLLITGLDLLAAISGGAG